MPARHLVLGGEAEPVEPVRRQGQEEIQLADGWERVTAEHFHRDHADVGRQVEFHCLGATRHVGHAQDDFVFAVRPGVFAGVGENPAIGRRQHFQRAATEGLGLLAHGEQAPGPVQQRMWIAGLGLYVDRQVAVLRVHDRR
ncbi:hypothetical protein D3C87_1271670 [compost metagenome]